MEKVVACVVVLMIGLWMLALRGGGGTRPNGGPRDLSDMPR